MPFLFPPQGTERKNLRISSALLVLIWENGNGWLLLNNLSNSPTRFQFTIIDCELFRCRSFDTFRKYWIKSMFWRLFWTASSASFSVYKSALSYSFWRRLLTPSAKIQASWSIGLLHWITPLTSLLGLNVFHHRQLFGQFVFYPILAFLLFYLVLR